jgi:hypothetical protein
MVCMIYFYPRLRDIVSYPVFPLNSIEWSRTHPKSLLDLTDGRISWLHEFLPLPYLQFSPKWQSSDVPKLMLSFHLALINGSNWFNGCNYSQNLNGRLDFDDPSQGIVLCRLWILRDLTVQDFPENYINGHDSSLIFLEFYCGDFNPDRTSAMCSPFWDFLHPFQRP